VILDSNQGPMGLGPGRHLLTALRSHPIIGAVKDTDEYRRASHEVWEAMAPGWERGRAYIWDVTRAVGERMLAALDPQPGETVLELAAGTGETGFAAARMVGSDGSLLSTDFSPAMVDAARRRGAELGLENVDYRVLDAERMDLPDASVDGVLCRYGYMLMADPAAALAETRRILKPDGRLSFAVVGAPESNPWAAVPGRVLVELGHAQPTEPGAPGIFAMADQARIRELVTGAGFDPPRVEEVDVVWSFADNEALWRFLTEVAGGIALVIRSLPEAEQLRVRSEVERASESLRSNGGYDMPGLTLNVLAA
jgi:ubiquinone/menaquinone biosynthesis C-methylase UbiE